MDLNVADRGYLIIGGTAGMGLAAAAVLVSEGARVAIAGRNAARVGDAATYLAGLGAAAVTVVGDVTQDGEADRIVEEAVDALGDLAGIAVTTGTGTAAHTDLEHSSDAVWGDAFDDLLMGTVRPVRAAIPHLVAGGGGTIVTTGAYSIHSYHPNRLPYVALKTAVVAFTKTIARAYGASGVRANCVCPGAIETDSLAHLRAQMATQRGVPPEGLLEKVMVEEWHMDVALGRPGRPAEIGEMFAFLLSPRAGYTSGAIINVDGGTEF